MLSRHRALRSIPGQQVFDEMHGKDILIKVARKGKVSEECSAAYKDVDEVVNTCVEAGIGKRCVRLRPFGVVKG
jgi:tRNA-splicing ligase RtcB